MSTASQAYLTGVITTALRRVAPPGATQHAGAPDAVRAAVASRVEAVLDELVDLADALHSRPETAFEETASVAAVTELLARHGVETAVGGWGLPTAFRAHAGAGSGPRIGIVAEYDALPGIGHACGHNLICAIAVGAFLAAGPALDEVGGDVVLLGTPGEEGRAGKELMARQGAFDDLDAVVMAHPAGFDMARHTWLGARSALVRYDGVAAHAAATPFLGRNALDALVLAYQGIGRLRQQSLPEDRVHLISTEGGTIPGVIPAVAAGRLGVRSSSATGLRELSERVEAVLTSAATATGTQVTVDWDERPPYLPMQDSVPLSDRYAVNLETTGRRLTQSGALPAGLSASTDLGNVSARVPAIQPLLKVSPPHVAVHTPEFAQFATGPTAVAAVRDGAVALALTMVDFLADETLRQDVAEAFSRQDDGAGWLLADPDRTASTAL